MRARPAISRRSTAPPKRNDDDASYFAGALLDGAPALFPSFGFGPLYRNPRVAQAMMKTPTANPIRPRRCRPFSGACFSSVRSSAIGEQRNGEARRSDVARSGGFWNKRCRRGLMSVRAVLSRADGNYSDCLGRRISPLIPAALFCGLKMHQAKGLQTGQNDLSGSEQTATRECLF
jgi:hypothetical protein